MYCHQILVPASGGRGRERERERVHVCARVHVGRWKYLAHTCTCVGVKGQQCPIDQYRPDQNLSIGLSITTDGVRESLLQVGQLGHIWGHSTSVMSLDTSNMIFMSVWPWNMHYFWDITHVLHTIFVYWLFFTHSSPWYREINLKLKVKMNAYIWFSMGMDHSNPFIHSTVIMTQMAYIANTTCTRHVIRYCIMHVCIYQSAGNCILATCNSYVQSSQLVLR